MKRKLISLIKFFINPRTLLVNFTTFWAMERYMPWIIKYIYPFIMSNLADEYNINQIVGSNSCSFEESVNRFAIATTIVVRTNRFITIFLYVTTIGTMFLAFKAAEGISNSFAVHTKNYLKREASYVSTVIQITKWFLLYMFCNSAIQGFIPPNTLWYLYKPLALLSQIITYYFILERNNPLGYKNVKKIL